MKKYILGLLFLVSIVSTAQSPFPDGVRIAKGVQLYSSGTYANKLGFGTLTPASAYDFISTTGGLTIPRMTTTQRNATSGQPVSSLIWNTTNTRFEYFDGSVWQPLITATIPSWQQQYDADPNNTVLDDGSGTFLKANNEELQLVDPENDLVIRANVLQNVNNDSSAFTLQNNSGEVSLDLQDSDTKRAILSGVNGLELATGENLDGDSTVFKSKIKSDNITAQRVNQTPDAPGTFAVSVSNGGTPVEADVNGNLDISTLVSGGTAENTSFDPTGLSIITAGNVQDALAQLDEAVGLTYEKSMHGYLTITFPQLLLNTPLVIGQRYRIADYSLGDDFTNVGASSNETGITFEATGTTPTIWLGSGVQSFSDSTAILTEQNNTTGKLFTTTLLDWGQVTVIPDGDSIPKEDIWFIPNVLPDADPQSISSSMIGMEVYDTGGFGNNGVIVNLVAGYSHSRIDFEFRLPSGGEGETVDSVNGQTGVVVLDAADVGADVAGAAAAALSDANDYTDSAVAGITTISGNAGTATALQTARTIGTVTGDATSAGSSFNGTVNNTNALTLATVNSNVGTFGSATQVASVTVNGKGLTTAASNVAIQIAESQVTGLVTDLAGKQSTLTNSAGLAAALSDETGTGLAVFNNAPTLANPIVGTQTAGDNSTKAASTAYSDRRRMFSHRFQGAAQTWNDNVTYFYAGTNNSGPTLVTGRWIEAGITATAMDFSITAYLPATLGTTENITIAIKNLTTGITYNLTTTFQATAATSSFAGTIAFVCTQRDQLECQVIVPNMATNPTGVLFSTETMLRN